MGRKLTSCIKQLVFDHYQKGTTAKKLHKNVFLDNKIVTLNYIKKLYSFFTNRPASDTAELINKAV